MVNASSPKKVEGARLLATRFLRSLLVSKNITQGARNDVPKSAAAHIIKCIFWVPEAAPGPSISPLPALFSQISYSQNAYGGASSISNPSFSDALSDWRPATCGVE